MRNYNSKIYLLSSDEQIYTIQYNCLQHSEYLLKHFQTIQNSKESFKHPLFLHNIPGIYIDALSKYLLYLESDDIDTMACMRDDLITFLSSKERVRKFCKTLRFFKIIMCENEIIEHCKLQE